MSRQIGFIGVGRMGSAMASNLLEGGVDVTVFDLDSAKVAELERAGATGATSIRALVESVDIVFTSLPTGESVREAYLGTDGLLDTADSGTMLVETSTVKPELLEEIESAIAEREADIDLVDAPVIGIPSTARKAELTILVGASDAAFHTVEPLLEQLGNEIRHVGPVGQAKAIKLLNNLLNYGNYAVAAEAFALASRYDVDHAEFFEIVDSGAARSSIVASKLPKALEAEFEPGFTIDGAIKDLRYAVELGADAGVQMPIAEMVRGRYEFAAERGRGAEDYSALLAALDQID